MAGCSGWLFDIMNESGYGWGFYSPLIRMRDGGREEGLKKKNRGGNQLFTSGFLSARCSPYNGGTLGVTSTSSVRDHRSDPLLYLTTRFVSRLSRREWSRRPGRCV